MKNKGAYEADVNLRNIHYHKKDGYYYLEKQIHGERYYEGCFKELSDALERRDYLDKYGWKHVRHSEGKRQGVKERIAKMYGISVEELP